MPSATTRSGSVTAQAARHLGSTPTPVTQSPGRQGKQGSARPTPEAVLAPAVHAGHPNQVSELLWPGTRFRLSLPTMQSWARNAPVPGQGPGLLQKPLRLLSPKRQNSRQGTGSGTHDGR